MRKRGLPIAQSGIRKIIKDAGYRYRKARKVLTSGDPNYEEKLKEITRTLQSPWSKGEILLDRRIWTIRNQNQGRQVFGSCRSSSERSRNVNAVGAR